MTMPCEPMPLLVPISERKAGEVWPSSKATRTSSSMVEAEAAVLLRDRQAEQAQLAHLRDDVGGMRVLLGDAASGHQPFAHETARQCRSLDEGFLVQSL